MRRRLFTTEQFYAEGGTRNSLRWGVRAGRWVRVCHGAFAEGSEPPSAFEVELGRMLAANTVAWGPVAGVLHGLDAVLVDEPLSRRRTVPVDTTTVSIGGIECTSGLQTIIDLAEFLNDLKWEQALESVLRTRRFELDDLAALVPSLAKSRRHGSTRIRRVLALRPIGAPPTESLLETLMVQMIRTIPDVPAPVRQYRVVNEHGEFVARVDLCWPGLGLFIELDGTHHAGQPVHDARRETAVVAATGWLCGRFTWREVHDTPLTTARRLAALFDQARRRPVAVV